MVGAPVAVAFVVALDSDAGPSTVSADRLDSILLSAVQMAPSSSQLEMAESTTLTSASESGSTVMRQRRLLGGFSRLALTLAPPSMVKASSLSVV